MQTKGEEEAEGERGATMVGAAVRVEAGSRIVAEAAANLPPLHLLPFPGDLAERSR